MSDTIRGAFHHIDLNVSDLAASHALYAPLLAYLGYVQVKEQGGYEWDLRAGEGRGCSIGLRLRDPGEAGHAHHRYAPGLHHLAWRAESRADVDRLHAMLVERGVSILDAPRHYPEYSGDYYALFFQDPDGMKLEYVYAPGWV